METRESRRTSPVEEHLIRPALQLYQRPIHNHNALVYDRKEPPTATKMPSTRKLLKRLRNIRGCQRTPYADNGAPQVHLPIPARHVPQGTDPAEPDRRPAIHLSAQAHPPHPLVDAAINSFTHHDALSPEQLRAKRLMTRHLLRSMTERQTHGVSNLRLFATWADTYFFQGALTRKPAAVSGPSPLQEFGAATAEEEARGHGFVLDEAGSRHCHIRVSQRRLREQRAWQFGKGAAFAGLLRVLARVYLRLFGCICAEHGCFARLPSTYGITGQGYCWHVFMGKITLEIRSWDHRLRGFADYRSGADGFDEVAAWREEEHWAVLMEDNEWRELVSDRIYEACGEYGLRIGVEIEIRVVQRKGEGLRREAQALVDETSGFAERGRRMTRAPSKYGFSETVYA